MNETFQPGDRVVVERVPYGFAEIHVGRTGTVKSRLSPSRYLVQMDYPRPERITATAIRAAVPPFSAGDRVRINGLSLYGNDYRGRTGVVVGASRHSSTHTVNVEPDGAKEDGVQVRRLFKPSDLTKIEPETGAKVGDDVVITDTFPEGLKGARGTVDRIESSAAAFGRRTKVFVRLAEDHGGGAWSKGQVVWAYAVEPGPKPEPEPTPEVLIDLKRIQAAQAAHAIVGKDALLDDLIGVADFLLGEHIRSSIGTTTLTTESIDLPLAPWERELLAATTAPTPAQDKSLVEAGFRVNDHEVASFDFTPDDDVVEIDGAYLKAADIDRLIDYLQAAKRHHEARRATSTPF